MVLRRVAAYFIDLAIYLLLIIGSLWMVSGIQNKFLNGFVAFLVILILTFIVFGFLSVLLRGSVGKKIMDLKILPTYGLVTPVRLYMRDALVKYGVYIPFGIGVYLVMRNSIDYRNVFVVLTEASLILMILLLIANLVTFGSKRVVMLDRIFYTRIENDIPTAQEYQDLEQFISEKK